MPASREAAERSARRHCGEFRIEALSAEEVIARQKEEAVLLVDVRTAPERRVSRLEGSVSVAEFEALDDEALRGKTVVCYCTIGRRSGGYATTLASRQSAPWARVFNSEGIVPFSHAAPTSIVDSRGEPATSLHVFAFPWDLGSAQFEVVKFGLVEAVLATVWPGSLR